MAGLQPPPFREPLLDARGQLTEQWRRFFLSTQATVTLILSGGFTNPLTGSPGGAMLGVAEALGADQGEGWLIPGSAGPQGPTGPAGAFGPPGLDGDDASTDLWLTGGLTRSGQLGTASPAIVASGRTVGAVAAIASVVAYTVGASDGSFEVSANVLVTTATTHAFTVECAYTSEDGTARVITLAFENLAGSFLTSVSNAQGAVPYEGVPLHLRCLAATTITIRTQAAGVYTAVVFNVEGIIRQLG